jgi:hypothetical protein
VANSNSITLQDGTVVNYSSIAITGSIPVQATKIIYSDGKEVYGIGALDPLAAYALAALPTVPAAPPIVVAPVVPPPVQTTRKIAKLNLTDAAHSATETDWQNLVVSNIEKTYSIANAWSIHFKPNVGISIGMLKSSLVDIIFPNDVLIIQLYANAAGNTAIQFDFLGLDPTKAYTITPGCFSLDNKPTTLTFGATTINADTNNKLAKPIFTSIKPDSTGKIAGVISGIGYVCINAIVISEDSSSGTVTPTPDPGTTTTPTDPTVLATLNAEEKLFTNAHYSIGAKLTANGSVLSFPDKIGGNDMQYVGITNPTITGIPPTQIDSGVFTMFDNRPCTNFHSAAFTPVKAPYELWYITRNMPGQPFEAKAEGSPISGYLANDGKAIRAIFNNVDVPGAAQAPFYQTIIERMVVKPNSVDYYVNGQLQGRVTDLSSSGQNTAKSIADNTTKSVHGIGTYTNCTDFDFAALYFKADIFSDTDALKIDTSLAAKWAVGTLPNQILLSNIGWNNVNGIYTASGIVINTPTGVTVAPQSQWSYQWYWMTSFDTQTLFSTKQSVTTANFPDSYASMTNFGIKCRIMPKDTNGNSWRYFSGLVGSYTQTASQTV